MKRKSPRTYTEEFKGEAVKLVLDHGYSQHQAAQSLGVSSRNISRWIQEGNAGKKESRSAEQKEIHALQKEVHRLRLEKEILKKAAAFFANELN